MSHCNGVSSSPFLHRWRPKTPSKSSVSDACTKVSNIYREQKVYHGFLMANVCLCVFGCGWVVFMRPTTGVTSRPSWTIELARAAAAAAAGSAQPASPSSVATTPDAGALPVLSVPDNQPTISGRVVVPLVPGLAGLPALSGGSDQAGGAWLPSPGGPGLATPKGFGTGNNSSRSQVGTPVSATASAVSSLVLPRVAGPSGGNGSVSSDIDVTIADLFRLAEWSPQQQTDVWAGFVSRMDAVRDRFTVAYQAQHPVFISGLKVMHEADALLQSLVAVVTRDLPAMRDALASSQSVTAAETFALQARHILTRLDKFRSYQQLAATWDVTVTPLAKHPVFSTPLTGTRD